MTLPAEGKWLASSNEEHWDCGEEFDTKDEAAVYAVGEFAKDYGVEPGRRVWIGRVESLDKPLDLAASMFDLDDALDKLGEALFEQCGEAAEDAVPTLSKREYEDFETHVRVAIATWLRANDKHVECFAIEHVESLVVPPYEED